MYQAETPVGLCKYKDNEKGNQATRSSLLFLYKFFINFRMCSDNFFRDP